MNKSALIGLILASRSIAVRPRSRIYDDKVNCVFCHALADFGSGDLQDENNHDENCPWRLLKEALANLDNEGY